MLSEAHKQESVLAEKEDIWRLRYNAALGIRYHMARQSFYRRLQRLISAFSLAFSTAAVAILFKNTSTGQILAAIVAIFQVLDLVIDTRGSSELHNNLRRDYLRLEQDLTQKVNQITIENLHKLSDRLTSIESEEPPIKRWLLESCRLDAEEYLGVDESNKKGKKLNFYKTLLMHIY